MRRSREDFFRNDAFSPYDLYGHAPAQEPLPRGSWNLQFRRPFFGHHYYILPCLIYAFGVEKKIFSEIYHLYGHAQHKKLCPVGHEINNFGRPLLGHNYYTLFYKEIYQFYTFLPQNALLLGVIKFKISCLLIQQMYHTKFG